MKQLNIFDFLEPETTEALKVSVETVEILKTIEEWRGCTSYAFKDIKKRMENYGLYHTKAIGYEMFNKLMVNIGLPFRDANRGVEPDFKTVKTFEGGHRLIAFSNRKYPVYCLGNKTCDGVEIGEVA